MLIGKNIPLGEWFFIPQTDVLKHSHYLFSWKKFSRCLQVTNRSFYRMSSWKFSHFYSLLCSKSPNCRDNITISFFQMKFSKPHLIYHEWFLKVKKLKWVLIFTSSNSNELKNWKKNQSSMRRSLYTKWALDCRHSISIVQCACAW